MNDAQQHINPTDDIVTNVPGTQIPVAPPQQATAEFAPIQSLVRDELRHQLGLQNKHTDTRAMRQDEKFRLVVENSQKYGVVEGLILLGVVLGTVAATLGIQALLSGGGDEVVG